MLVSPPMMEKLDSYMEIAYQTIDGIACLTDENKQCMCAKPITNRDKHHSGCTFYNQMSNVPPYYECLCDHIDDELTPGWQNNP